MTRWGVILSQMYGGVFSFKKLIIYNLFCLLKEKGV